MPSHHSRQNKKKQHRKGRAGAASKGRANGGGDAAASSEPLQSCFSFESMTAAIPNPDAKYKRRCERKPTSFVPPIKTDPLQAGRDIARRKKKAKKKGGLLSFSELFNENPCRHMQGLSLCTQFMNEFADYELRDIGDRERVEEIAAQIGKRRVLCAAPEKKHRWKCVFTPCRANLAEYMSNEWSKHSSHDCAFPGQTMCNGARGSYLASLYNAIMHMNHMPHDRTWGISELYTPSVLFGHNMREVRALWKRANKKQRKEMLPSKIEMMLKMQACTIPCRLLQYFLYHACEYDVDVMDMISIMDGMMVMDYTSFLDSVVDDEELLILSDYRHYQLAFNGDSYLEESMYSPEACSCLCDWNEELFSEGAEGVVDTDSILALKCGDSNFSFYSVMFLAHRVSPLSNSAPVSEEDAEAEKMDDASYNIFRSLALHLGWMLYRKAVLETFSTLMYDSIATFIAREAEASLLQSMQASAAACNATQRRRRNRANRQQQQQKETTKHEVEDGNESHDEVHSDHGSIGSVGSDHEFTEEEEDHSEVCCCDSDEECHAPVFTGIKEKRKPVDAYLCNDITIDVLERKHMGLISSMLGSTAWMCQVCFAQRANMRCDACHVINVCSDCYEEQTSLCCPNSAVCKMNKKMRRRARSSNRAMLASPVSVSSYDTTYRPVCNDVNCAIKRVYKEGSCAEDPDPFKHMEGVYVECVMETYEMCVECGKAPRQHIYSECAHALICDACYNGGNTALKSCRICTKA